MKVKKIIKKEDYWVNFINPVEVMTSEGIKMCTKAYINGIRDIFSIKFSDGLSVNFTDNHKLLSQNNTWEEVKNIDSGFIFNNGLLVESKTYKGKDFVLDMEIPDVHHYLLKNGIISHNSAFILGQVSQSIEPYDSNYYIKELAKGKFVVKNRYLEALLIEKGMNTDEVWNSIMEEKGSVLHLDFLSDDEKLVFKTAREISQEEIIVQAGHRQKYIDQGQSLNLFISVGTSAKEVNRLTLLAHDLGVKSLYYQHNFSAASEFARKFTYCVSCE